MNKLTKSMNKIKQRSPLSNWDLSGFFDGDDLFVPLRHLTSAFDGNFTPKVNVVERKNKLIVEAELPGMTKDDVNIFVEGEFLVIEGERQEESESEEDGVVRKESRYGSFHRTIPIGSGVDPDKVKAKFKNGMVRVEMPHQKKKEPSRSEIPIM